MGPVVVAGVLLGAGLGGFVDGIALHQIAQWHNMISARLPTDTLLNAKVNMFWDGVFHAGVWALTVVGLGLLFRAGGRADTAWSGRVLLGALVLGWGVFNFVEGTINHQILGLHHVNELSENLLAWDLGFLAFGAVLAGGGWALIQAGASVARPPGHRR